MNKDIDLLKTASEKRELDERTTDEPSIDERLKAVAALLVQQIMHVNQLEDELRRAKALVTFWDGERYKLFAEQAAQKPAEAPVA